MESLSETEWDAVISGTGLHQSLLALALSRSGKNILHVDRNNYYGGNEAALSLQEADDWAARFSSPDADSIFAGAEVQKEDGVSSSRAYSLALAPQLIHAKSDLLDKLVSSKAFRQLEFLAVGSFFIYQPSSESKATLARIPSTREDVFANKFIPPRPQRLLMKFLKFVLDYQSETQSAIWTAHKDKPLADFLVSEFKLDSSLQSYVLTLTLSSDGQISVENGLFIIHRHLTSMGVFGPGFAAVYPKWGGLSEIAQVGCRAGAVGGAIYMLGTGIKGVKQTETQPDADRTLTISLDNDCDVRSKALIQETDSASGKGPQLSRLTAVVNSPISSLFQAVVEGAPTPSVSIVAFPTGTVSLEGETVSTNPVYAVLHSADTGECPIGQSVIYLSTPKSSTSKQILEHSLTLLLDTIEADETPKALYRLSYNQTGGCETTLSVSSENIATFGPLPLDIAFNDSILSPVKNAWDLVKGQDIADDAEYLVFEDREGANDEDDVFDG